MGFPFDMYEDMFKKKTGAEFTKDEAQYVLVYPGFCNRIFLV